MDFLYNKFRRDKSDREWMENNIRAMIFQEWNPLGGGYSRKNGICILYFYIVCRTRQRRLCRILAVCICDRTPSLHG